MNLRYSIGIDLGTTNCALAYVDLSDPEGESQVLGIRQLETANTEVERSTLPSFLYLGDDGDCSAGLYARERGREVPEWVVHSAKSWLCHHSVSPQAQILPWKSKAVEDVRKLSPIAASAKLLEVLRLAWESQIGAEAPFGEQAVTITVPASFDAAAQAATLEAARLAGYPEGVRLLEEPQAAFYRWLEAAGEAVDSLQAGERILVVDIGGGTSDFSLFEVGASKKGSPQIERISVSEHLLLGGDNIDLALAHALESELAPAGEELSVDQWGHLISRARELKETCLSEDLEEDRSISVSLPSKGAGLFAGTLSTEVSSQMARELILEGFFPECSTGSKAERATGGLLEMGLPYAVDCAVTRHLAEYLGDDARVAHILFNGGSLSAKLIRDRLRAQFAKWRGGVAAGVLNNAETDLAVARGAAHYGATLRRGTRQIEAGAARSIFLEVSSDAGTKRVCVLPKGAQPGESFEVALPGLRLAVNQRVRFRAFQGTDAMRLQAGEFCIEGLDAMKELPALETLIGLEDQDSVAVRLRSGVNELGLLTVCCESLEADVSGEWKLEFNLRSDAGSVSEKRDKEFGVGQAKVERAARALKGALLARGSELKASRVMRELESVLGLPKHEWTLDLCRELLDAVFESEDALLRNSEGAESWLQIAGYLTRPGFGAAGDDGRLSRLSSSIESLGATPAKVEVQKLILLRRVAAGFSEAEQATLFESQFVRLNETKRAEAERIRLLASLEKVELTQKQRLFDLLFARLEAGLAADKSIAALLAGFAGLLNRTLFRASEDRIMPPEKIEQLFDRLRKLDWASSGFADAVPLFMKAARVVDDRSLNVSKRCASKIASKLEKSGVAANRLLPLRDYVPLTRVDVASSFGEALPPGLVLES